MNTLLIALAILVTAMLVGLFWTTTGENKLDNHDYTPKVHQMFSNSSISLATQQFISNTASSYENSSQTNSIQLISHWKMEKYQNTTLAVAFATKKDLPDKELIMDYSRNVVFSHAEAQSSLHLVSSDIRQDNSQKVPSWIDFLASLDPGRKLYPSFREANADEVANITITLTKDTDPSGGFARTTTYLDENGDISLAKITVYAADNLYAKGYLSHVLLHELGHALGLNHSNDMTSMMYPKIEVVDGIVIGKLADCERQGLSSLYEHLKQQATISCN